MKCKQNASTSTALLRLANGIFHLKSKAAKTQLLGSAPKILATWNNLSWLCCEHHIHFATLKWNEV